MPNSIRFAPLPEWEDPNWLIASMRQSVEAFNDALELPRMALEQTYWEEGDDLQTQLKRVRALLQAFVADQECWIDAIAVNTDHLERWIDRNTLPESIEPAASGTECKALKVKSRAVGAPAETGKANP